MRRLASVQRINRITPINDADRIELVHVLGWQCIAKKGEFNVGDLCVYFEIDSFLPIRPEFEFLRASSYKNSELLGEGFRLKTQKMRGEISQGLCLPMSILDHPEEYKEGCDVTEVLNVCKWEIPEMATTGGTMIGNLPYGVPHTDEVRIQAVPELLQEFAKKEYYITTKMDGSSHSISIDENGIHVTGHNYEYKDDGKSSFYEFAKKNGFIENIVKYKETHYDVRMMTIQGEYCGAGIQSNKLGLKMPMWYVFTIIINGRRVGMHETQKICMEIGLTMVPNEEKGFDLPHLYPDVETLLKRADGKYPNGHTKEGIVIRPVEPVYSNLTGEYLSMKVINNKYLLKK